MKIYSFNGQANISGRNIRRAREELQLSQEQLAAKMQLEGVQVNQKAISRIETGDRVVADYELKLLAKILKISLEDILGE